MHFVKKKKIVFRTLSKYLNPKGFSYNLTEEHIIQLLVLFLSCVTNSRPSDCSANSDYFYNSHGLPFKTIYLCQVRSKESSKIQRSCKTYRKRAGTRLLCIRVAKSMNGRKHQPDLTC